MDRQVERKRIENDLRQVFEQSLPTRIQRYMEIKPHPIIANHHFSSVSTECIDLYRDGHFFGCISLIQAVAEALVKFLCFRNGWKPDKVFEENINKLVTRSFISSQIKNFFLEIWDKRDDYHHLNSTVENDRKKLESMAKTRLDLLSKIESEIFNFKIVDGKISPTNPKYWDIKGNTATVYLRCD